jgi:hypothetical protein
MAVTITRTPWIDDDGTGTTGTVINNAVKTALYNDIDGALAKVAQLAGGNAFTGTQVGDFKLSGDYYEKSRATPVGHWIDYVATITATAGTVTVNSLATCRYMLVGKTLTVTVYANLTPSATPAAFLVTLPAGFLSAGFNTFAVCSLPPALGPGVVQSSPGTASLAILRDINSTNTFPATATWVGFTHAFAVQ